MAVLLEQSAEVLPRRDGVDILCLVKDNVRLWLERVRLLVPEVGNRASYLNKTCHHWHVVIHRRSLMAIDNLLDFDPICRPSFLINTSSEVTRTSVVSTTASDQSERELVASIDEVLEVDVAVDYWHHPLVTFQQLVQVSNQEIVPHHLVFPRFVLLDFLFVLLLFVRSTGFTGLVHLSTGRVHLVLFGWRIGLLAVGEEVICVDFGEVVNSEWSLVCQVVLPSLADHVFLERACQVIGVGEIKSFLNLDLHEYIQIPVLVVLAFIVG